MPPIQTLAAVANMDSWKRKSGGAALKFKETTLPNLQGNKYEGPLLLSVDNF